jgi:outer membrane autotransporter protein
VDIQPLASIELTHVWRNSFTERGAQTLNLEVDSRDATSVRGSLGARIAKTWKKGNGVALTPELRVRCAHEFSHDDHLVKARFSGSSAGSFTVKGDGPIRDSAVLGAGITGVLGEHLSLGIHYDVNLSSDQVAHAVAGGVMFRW